MEPLNLFYEEPDPDRWLPFDRYPRRVVRRVVRGKPRMGGHRKVFLNLCTGLERLSIPYRVNDYKYIQKHSDEIACIVGKPHVLDKVQWKSPILFGTACFSHPSDDPTLFERLPVRKMLVPGEWMRKMFEPYYGDRVSVWPVGIDTEEWLPASTENKTIDILLYDKILWDYDSNYEMLINPLREILAKRNLSVTEIRYGFYREAEFRQLLDKTKAMIFLCEHETQGIAYQQALSCGVPILAWDQGDYWQDPSYFPHRVKFSPVSSVPYWDDRCGIKFKNIAEFSSKLDEFLEKIDNQQFFPRDYILENLTLEESTRRYVDLLGTIKQNSSLVRTV